MPIKIRYDNDKDFNFYLTIGGSSEESDYITIIPYDKLSEFLERIIYGNRAKVDLKPERGLAKRLKNLEETKNA